jgi:hypothetical protein
MNRRRTLTMEDILNGVSSGEAQYVGNMGVIPLVSDNDRFDENDFGTADDFEVRTSEYGTVHVRERSGRTNFVPPGAGWVVEQAAQDHAVGSGKIMKGGSESIIRTARCIQSSQSGYIRGATEMLILPAELRSIALAKRKERGYNLIWGELGEFNSRHGLSFDQQLAVFVKTFKKQMDEFVAEFELLDNQVGAIVLLEGKVVGIELSPTRAYWRSIWYPLIRVCYGSLARACYQQNKDKLPLFPDSSREPLQPRDRTLKAIHDALLESKAKLYTAAEGLLSALRAHPLSLSPYEDEEGGMRLRTVALPKTEKVSMLGGQVVTDKDSKVPLFSVCIS